VEPVVIESSLGGQLGLLDALVDFLLKSSPPTFPPTISFIWFY
jgi:hypothetical protein